MPGKITQNNVAPPSTNPGQGKPQFAFVRRDQNAGTTATTFLETFLTSVEQQLLFEQDYNTLAACAQAIVPIVNAR